MPYCRQASRLLIVPVRTLRRISVHSSISAYTSVPPCRSGETGKNPYSQTCKACTIVRLTIRPPPAPPSASLLLRRQQYAAQMISDVVQIASLSGLCKSDNPTFFVQNQAMPLHAFKCDVKFMLMPLLQPAKKPLCQRVEPIR